MKILKIALLSVFYIKNSLGFMPFHKNNQIVDLIIQKNNEFYKNYDNLGDYKKYLEPNLFSEINKYNTLDLKEISETVKINVGNNVVKQLSSGLPHVDNIGHNILHANNVFINDVLNSPYLTHDMQKTIILNSIKLAQHGDNFGSELLQLYYNIVDYFL